MASETWCFTSFLLMQSWRHSGPVGLIIIVAEEGESTILHVTITQCPLANFFYGTAWKEDRTAALTELAIRQGFRAIDTANQRRHYFEAGVGEGLPPHIARA